MSKGLFKPIAAVMLTSAATVALMTAPTAVADTADRAELQPIEYAESSVDYLYLDAPKSISKDASGFVVTERNSVDYIEEVSGEYKITKTQPIVADKAITCGNYLVTSYNGSIEFHNGAAMPPFDPSFHAVDFTVSNGTLYVLGEHAITSVDYDADNNTFDTDNTKTIEFISDEYPSIESTAIAVCDGEIFVAVNSAVFADKQDLCSLDPESGVLTPAVLQSDKILSLATLDAQSTVYALTRDKISGYYNLDGNLQPKFSTDGAGMSKLCAHDGFVYGLSTLNSIVKYSHELETAETLVAAASDKLGFFNLPSAVAVKNSELYVADTINNRIVKYGNGAPVALDIELKNPVSVACDTGGTLYIAHDVNKFAVVAQDGTTELSASGAIKQVAVDADKTAYVLTDDGLFRVKNGGDKFERISETKYKAITLGIGKYELYALDADSIVKFALADNAEDITSTSVASADSDTCSIAVDLKNGIYALTKTAIVKTKDGVQTRYKLAFGDKDYSLGFTRGQIAVSTIVNNHVAYGDIIIADAYKHRLFTVGGDALGVDVVVCVGDGDDDPAKSSTPEIFNDGSRLIRTALRDTTVFSMPAETEPVYTIKAGRRVIVPEYRVADFPEYSLVVIEKLDEQGIPTGELVQGYVYRETLSEPLTYSEPPENTATVYINAPIYKWPSPNAKVFCTYKGAEPIEIVSFVREYDEVHDKEVWYRDDYGDSWYRVRVSIDNGPIMYEGFVPIRNISINGFVQTNLLPQYDAEIIEYEGSTLAQAYDYDEETKTHVEIKDLGFEVGTRVEIVGTYDTSEQYTQIIYYDENLGSRTCYVRTVYLKYYGVDIVPIIAWIVIGITAVLAAIIIAIVVYTKRKRVTSLPNEN